jgi:ketosteroid isomerase-like protein
MKNLVLILITLFLLSCKEKNNQSEIKSTNINELDIEAELASIEETRKGFQLAIKEKRYTDLRSFGTKDIISLTPICGTWEEYKRLRNEPVGSFSYDSLIMKPKETIIVSDSIAYDFGTSSVYYTNEQGEPVEIEDTFLAILKKDKSDGKWKLHREVATTNKLEK